MQGIGLLAKGASTVTRRASERDNSGRGEAAALRAAFESLLRENETALVRTARRLCGAGSGEWEDLVQKAVVRAYLAYCEGRFEEGTNARAWLLRILTNVYINDYHRERARPARVPLDDAAAVGRSEPAAPAHETPDSVLMAKTLDEPVERALEHLSASLRACIVLVDIEGLEYADAACALGIPIGTVRSRLARARLQLQEQLYEYAVSLRRV